MVRNCTQKRPDLPHTPVSRKRIHFVESGYRKAMPTRLTHSWDLSPAEARELQLELRNRIVTSDQFTAPHTVAGVDVGFKSQGRVTRAAVAVLSFPDLLPLDQAVSYQPTRFPYIPGLLSFREIPAILEAMNALSIRPDMLLCDGQGLAHPRRFGLACHLGLLTDIPSIGVAKSRLIGTHGDLESGKRRLGPAAGQG